MKLLDYMKSTGIGDAEFARMTGAVSARAVAKWKYGETRPRVRELVMIERVTNGKVRVVDFLPNSEPASMLSDAEFDRSVSLRAAQSSRETLTRSLGESRKLLKR